jgi:hypothetical protein
MPDYDGVQPEQAVRDFTARIEARARTPPARRRGAARAARAARAAAAAYSSRARVLCVSRGQTA